MLRLIVRTHDFGAAANVGGPTSTHYRTFGVHLPEVESYLAEAARWSYSEREVVGVELVPDGVPASGTSSTEECDT